eukprot:m.100844 g.100844  ORF g.100844 m.100844 type:complete len:264 (-) comp15142_c1_seq5:815-1606(-)
MQPSLTEIAKQFVSLPKVVLPLLFLLNLTSPAPVSTCQALDLGCSATATMANDYALVWLHGLGDRGRSFEMLRNDFRKFISAPLHLKLPDAPLQPVDCNNGMASHSWFNIADIPIEEGAKDYPDDIATSVAKIHAYIKELHEKDGIAYNRIFVGGFSQGGALTLQAVLRHPERLGGGIVLSGWLMLPDTIGALTHASNAATQFFWGHGTRDNVVLPTMQQHGCAKLTELGHTVEMQSYPVGHSLHPKELREMVDWTKKALGDE